MQHNKIFVIRTCWKDGTEEKFNSFHDRLKGAPGNHYEFTQMGNKEQVNGLSPVEAYEWLKKNMSIEDSIQILVIFDEISSKDGSALLLRVSPDEPDEHCQAIRSDTSMVWECNGNLEIVNMDWYEFVDWARESGGILPGHTEK